MSASTFSHILDLEVGALFAEHVAPSLTSDYRPRRACICGRMLRLEPDEGS